MKTLLLTFALLLCAVPSWAADCSSVFPGLAYTCDGSRDGLDRLFNSDIPNQTQAGAVITVTGSATWANSLRIGERGFGGGYQTPPFTLQCNPGVTFTRGASFTDAVPSGMIVLEALTLTTGYRITGCTINGNSFTTPGGGLLAIFARTLNQVRIDHVSLTNVAQSRAFVWNGNRTSGAPVTESSGLFDHDECHTIAGSSVQCFSMQQWWTGSNVGFAFGKNLGTNHAVYVEDSVCDYLNSADSCLDGQNGVSIVFRYNTMNLNMGLHGADSTPRGANAVEYYRNKMSNPTASHYVMGARTGPDVAFDNIATGANWSSQIFTLYRTRSAFGTKGKCDGSSLWDGNLGSGTPVADGLNPIGNPGWPCLDQTGWYFTGVSPTVTATAYPAYFVGNTINGSPMTHVNNDQPIQPGCVQPNCQTYSTNYIVNNRDYYTNNGASCTSGGACTTGVGRGTTLPTTCTPSSVAGGTYGVGFWKTNEGSWNTSTLDATFNPSGLAGEDGVLYACTATNTWSLYYTPYTYPHPLQGTADTLAPAAPTGITVN